MGNAINAASLSAYFAALLVLLLLGLILFKVFGAPFRFLAVLLLNSLAGGVALFLLSFIFDLFGLSIAVSIFSAVIVGVLGLPGLLLVIALNFLL